MDTYAISYIQACSSQYIVLHESSSHSLLRIKAFRSCPLSRIVVILSLALVLAGSSLASLELLEVPVADLHVAAVLVEALCEVLGGTGAVVVLLLLLGSGLGLDGSSRFGGAAAEEAADGVADGGANGDTGSSAGHLAKQSGALGSLLRRSHGRGSVLLRRSRHGGRRAALLRRRSRDGGARRSAGGRALTRHGDGRFLWC